MAVSFLRMTCIFAARSAAAAWRRFFLASITCRQQAMVETLGKADTRSSGDGSYTQPGVAATTATAARLNWITKNGSLNG